MPVYTDEQFTAAFDKAVAMRGEDYIYRRPTQAEGGNGMCVYSTRDGEPSCLIGLALWILDQELGTHNMPSFNDCINAYSLLEGHGLTSKRVATAAGNAQATQDATYTWGEAKITYHHFLEVYDMDHPEPQIVHDQTPELVGV